MRRLYFRRWTPVRCLSVVGAMLVAIGGTPHAHSETVSLDLDGPVDRQSVAYECRASADAQPTSLSVEYLNMPTNNLAILPVEGSPRLFVSTLSASGAKYVSGEWVWWTKGPRGDLYSERRKESSETTVCRVTR
ncbi:Membrane-bound inhibitor of C-type lysozyme [Fulvimarina manganoxydans]|uniref:Membrane-bound inhibitor of C-type lysozyme n=1 Tax=Fulvimarina manganoxydans TaxID=937218 RepID=A0A1W1YKA3_9HYPH|nr:MliC family protein [Fulvimarina manganoxydans]SMC36670.1 Membrane-bound inhibitor of C-type lysozyme [Fulvimarina manganoxydans]